MRSPCLSSTATLFCPERARALTESALWLSFLASVNRASCWSYAVLLSIDNEAHEFIPRRNDDSPEARPIPPYQLDQIAVCVFSIWLTQQKSPLIGPQLKITADIDRALPALYSLRLLDESHFDSSSDFPPNKPFVTIRIVIAVEYSRQVPRAPNLG